MKREFFLLLLLAWTVFPLRADDNEPVWSPAQRGLQARLFISKPETQDYAFGISIEFRNVLEDSAAISQMLKVSFTRDELVFTVRDAAGRVVLPSPPGDMDVLEPIWGLTFPPGARESFPIGRGGPKFLSLGGARQWVLAPGGGPYRLAATFTHKTLPHGGPGLGPARGFPFPDFPGAWVGSIDLPPIALPQN